MPAEISMHAYKAHCFFGHSPIRQVDIIKKFLKLHANSIAAKTILNRFAHIKGRAKKAKDITAKKLKNLPA
jgi:hypothetical protein